MEKLLSGKISPSLVGLGQALFVAVYCALIASFLFFLGNFEARIGVFGVFFMLVLLVFSASVTGTAVFGLPVYFALNHKTKEAFSILAYTLCYCLIIILLTAFVVALIS